MNSKIGRRAALFGAAGLLAGCDTIDGWFGTTKTPLPGLRQSVLSADGAIKADPALSGTAIALPPPTVLQAWPMPGGNPSHAIGHVALGPNLSEAWSASIGEGSAYRSRITSGPIIANGLVITSDASNVISAYDLARGDRRWRFDTSPDDEDGGSIGGGCAVEGDTVYVVSGQAEVLALNIADGKPRWRQRIPATGRGAPAIAGGKLIFATIDNQVIAVSATDGKKLWSYQGQRVPTVPLGLPTPAIVEDMAVAGLPSGELVLLRVSDGRVVWTESVAGAGRAGSLTDISGIHALPVVADGRVFAIGMGGTSIAVDLRSGRRLWEREMGGTVTPAVAGDWIFAVTDGALITAVGRDDGRFRWVTALNDGLTEKEREERRGTRYAAPVLAGGRLIVAGDKSEALIIDPATGGLLQRMKLPGPVSLPAAVTADRLVMLTDEGRLVCWRGA
ncbi:PQQ-binding-like beta-propeller repeat protein [Acetobacteraceae bacterium H6797]|nr:PQQ-binding-like beta-propeller repeat protein [Acetobacteraceae bacterium H6797]